MQIIEKYVKIRIRLKKCSNKFFGKIAKGEKIMKRRNSENKQKVNLVIFLILIIGAILGVIVGCTIELNTTSILIRIACCFCTASFGSIMALIFTYFGCEAIEETQDMIKARKKKDFH